MLINLSNHPKKLWCAKQTESAISAFCSIIDIAFPSIPPDADSKYITHLAEEYAEKILIIISNSEDKANAVHIMGEMNLCFSLITLLKSKNIICLASTSKRSTLTMESKKISEFNFVSFREY
ncbi:MAG: CRISPR-associated protein [Bacteroidetes bacterium]|nr:CRISPR-associated protein [Bacteroidota bacterium]MBU1678851.1 CRISPR-associated protein [Bacteroidota bacterium]